MILPAENHLVPGQVAYSDRERIINVIGYERVDEPAGQFEALHIEYWFGEGGALYYYAAGIGMVQFNYGYVLKKDMCLSSYRIP